MADEPRSNFEEELNDVAVRYLERLTNVWIKQGLPLPILARAMMGMGVSCIEGAEGHATATEMVRRVSEQLVDNSPPIGLAN